MCHCLQAPIFAVAVEAADAPPYSVTVVIVTGDGNDENKHSSFMRAIK